MLLAVGPQLVAAYSSGTTILNPDEVLHVAPTELRNAGVNSIQVTRGGDHVLGNGNDIAVDVGAILVATTTTDVIVRFANPLVDDLYQVTIVGSGANPLRDVEGDAFNDGVDLTRNFTLDLGTLVTGIVPQPVSQRSP
jgi:hypothetical protein